eukprot:1092393-Rhodomonas_salina.5
MSANSGKSRAVLGARVYGETVLLCAGAKAKAVLFPEWKVVLFSASREIRRAAVSLLSAIRELQYCVSTGAEYGSGKSTDDVLWYWKQYGEGGRKLKLSAAPSEEAWGGGGERWPKSMALRALLVQSVPRLWGMALGSRCLCSVLTGRMGLLSYQERGSAGEEFLSDGTKPLYCATRCTVLRERPYAATVLTYCTVLRARYAMTGTEAGARRTGVFLRRFARIGLGLGEEGEEEGGAMEVDSEEEEEGAKVRPSA